jgi:hypothetical protein
MFRTGILSPMAAYKMANTGLLMPIERKMPPLYETGEADRKPFRSY